MLIDEQFAWFDVRLQTFIVILKSASCTHYFAFRVFVIMRTDFLTFNRQSHHFLQTLFQKNGGGRK
jgi:hypothetical protein